MSYDDYVTHVAQRYRLAISIAIIRAKPENISLDSYIQSLRNKINEDQMDIDNLSASICSEDFRMGETDKVPIVFDINNDNITDNDKAYTGNDKMKQQNDINDEKNRKTKDLSNVNINLDQNSSKFQDFQSIHDENDIIIDINETNVQMTVTDNLNDSVTVLQNFEETNINCKVIDTEVEKRSSLTEVMELLKNVDDNWMNMEMGVTNQNRSKSTQDEGGNNQCFTINDATLCESLDILSNVGRYDLSQTFNNDYSKNQTSCHKHSHIEKRIQNVDLHKVNLKECNRNEMTYQFTTNTTELNISNTKPNCNTKKNNSVDESSCKIKEPKPKNTIRDYRHTKEYKTIYQNVANMFDTYKPKPVLEDLDKVAEISKDSQIINTMEDLTCCTHYSESQVNDAIVIEDKYIHGNNKNNKDNHNSDNIKVNTQQEEIDYDIFSQEAQRTDFSIWPNNTNEIINNEKNYNEQNENNTKRKVVYMDNDIFSQESHLTSTVSCKNNSPINNNKTYVNTITNFVGGNNGLTNEKNSAGKVIKSQITNLPTLSNNISKNGNSSEFSQCAQNENEYFEILQSNNDRSCTEFDRDYNNIPVAGRNIHFDKEQLTNVTLNESALLSNMPASGLVKSCINCDDHFDSTQVDLAEPIAVEGEKRTATDESCTNFDNTQNMDVENEWTDSQTELIPFKVIEELNKVKMYVNRKNENASVENSNDTGYKSSSQSKSSFRGSQHSQPSAWLDQSAHCLIGYITECPLVATTQEITYEISMVLGLLIDKLHEEEKYPTFLEQLLDTVQSYLNNIRENNGVENQLIEKEEIIQRLILLNNSTQIQKYTIEKVTCILENLHSDLTAKDSLYEIENIDRIENTCYIFHILEVILQKHIKSSQNLSQSSTQEDKVLKKSSIMDIWRKKWNPDYKECADDKSQEKTSVITNCSVVLNKLIVGCMDGYSLISYYALKCFNMMQI